MKAETEATIIPGLLDTPGILDQGDKTKIDTLTPDYSILADANFTYELQNSYIGYATRGFPNGCDFCAVHQIEKDFKGYQPLRRQIQMIEELYGEKRDLFCLTITSWPQTDSGTSSMTLRLWASGKERHTLTETNQAE